MPVYSYDRVMLEMVLLKEKRINTPAELSLQHVAQSDPKPRLMMVPNLGKQLVGELIDSPSFVFVGRSFCFSMNMHGYVRHDFPGAVIVIYDIAKYIKSLLHFLNVFKGLFLMWTIFLKSLLNLLQYRFCFVSWFFRCKALGMLAPWPGIEPTPTLHWKAKFNHWTTREVPLLHFRQTFLTTRRRFTWKGGLHFVGSFKALVKSCNKYPLCHSWLTLFSHSSFKWPPASLQHIHLSGLPNTMTFLFVKHFLLQVPKYRHAIKIPKAQ